ncbi:hypothetical protein M3Y97_00060000 [Aphelenchoides bicaudatus]|nr:hypothetical protein M3Y97_00060000 [Aphelenchoides bicaudatus]
MFLAIVFDGGGYAIDPLEGIIKDFAYAARSAIQQTLNQVKMPRFGFSPNTGLSFQTDEDEDVNQFRCPICASSPRVPLVGSWYLVLWSRSFYLTVINDLNRIVDRIEAGKPIYTEQTLNDLFSDPIDIRCPRLTVLNLTTTSKCEFVYQLFNGRQKSIISSWENVPTDGSYFWRIAPTLNARFKLLTWVLICVAYTNIANQTSDYDFIVLNQIDSWPSCSNFIALTRSRIPDLVNNLRDFLEQQKVEGPFNKLEKVLCPYSQQIQPSTVPTPIEPPEDPFELPNANATVDISNNTLIN